MRRWRKMTWVVIAWTALILLWMIAGAAGNDCADEVTKLEQDACAAGTGIGVLLVALIGFFGFVFLSIIWFMTRPRTRDCPRCGEGVKKGVMRCQSCGFDFANVGGGSETADRVRAWAPE